MNMLKKISNKPARKDIIGVILAAGKGVRAYPSTKYIPKVLLDVEGKSLIERNIELMKKLRIKKILIVIGYLGHMIADNLKIKNLGVDISFVVQKEQKGIGHALLTVEKYVGNQNFLVILGDELYIDSNHSKILDLYKKGYDLVVGFREEKDKSKISKNFTGNIKENRIKYLIEKPENPNNNLMGVGTYLLNSKVFDYIRNTPPSKLRNEVEITDVLSNMSRNEKVYACMINGDYINITTVDDVNSANYELRNKNFHKYVVSVVIPAYNEEKTIASVVKDFNSHDAVDEVLVVDNNSKDKTSDLARKAGARVIFEDKRGYGCAIKRGFDEAKGDILILTEADGSFRSKDIPKFLDYLKDCDMVIGTRTTRQMVEQGANMKSFLRWGNVFFGKFIEVLWWDQEPRFTDVGCTYRAIWKTSYNQIKHLLKSTGPEFSPEMMVAISVFRKRVIEIPISYLRRAGGESKHSANYCANIKTGFRMLRVVLKYLFKYKFRL